MLFCTWISLIIDDLVGSYEAGRMSAIFQEINDAEKNHILVKLKYLFLTH